MLEKELLDLLNNPDVPNEVIYDYLLERGHNVASVYIVVGATGEYSDRTDWYVSAYLDKKLAEEYCEKLNNWCKENNLYYNRYEGIDDYDAEIKCPYDPNFSTDYTGTSYGVAEIPLHHINEIVKG